MDTFRVLIVCFFLLYLYSKYLEETKHANLVDIDDIGNEAPVYLSRQKMIWSPNEEFVSEEKLHVYDKSSSIRINVLTESVFNEEIVKKINSQGRGVHFLTLPGHGRLSLITNFLCHGKSSEKFSICAKILFHHICSLDNDVSRNPYIFIKKLAEVIIRTFPSVGQWMSLNPEIHRYLYTYECSKSPAKCLDYVIVKSLIRLNSEKVHGTTDKNYLIIVEFVEECHMIGENMEWNIYNVLRQLIRDIPNNIKFILISRRMKFISDQLDILSIQNMFAQRTGKIIKGMNVKTKALNIKRGVYNIQINVQLSNFYLYPPEIIYTNTELQCAAACTGRTLCCLASFKRTTRECYLRNPDIFGRCEVLTVPTHGVNLFIQEVAAQFREARRIVNKISVMNGMTAGTWQPQELCPSGTFATGFNIKVEAKISGPFADNSALNSVKITCSNGVHITSGEGAYGQWKSEAHCGAKLGKPSYLVSFKLQVEPEQGIGVDDSAANWISFKCRELDIDNSYQLDIPPGKFHWGTYGAWSASCPMYHAICGLETRVDEATSVGGNSALNDVRFFCCNK